MRAVRRFYFYLLTLISLELVIWGLYTLISSIWKTPEAIGLQDLLALGLAQILIGLPIFIFHGSIVQRDAREDEEENHSHIRAFFIYVIRLATLGAALIGLIGLLKYLLMISLTAPYIHKGFADYHNALDSLTIIVINLLVWYVVQRILLAEGKESADAEARIKIRRIYRYVWLIIGISALTAGIQLLLRDILLVLPDWESSTTRITIEHIALILVAAPVWAWTWKLLQTSYAKEEEKKATIRLVVLYGITLVSVAFVLSICGILLNHLFGWLLGNPNSLKKFISMYSSEISLLVPFSVLWAYYGKKLQQAIHDEPELLQQNMLQRILSAILSLTGNVVTFIGLWTLIALLTDIIFGIRQLGSGTRNQLTSGITLLIIGLPLWIKHWKILQTEIIQPDDIGQHARRSTLRRIYLYLIIFGSVIGAMIVGGILIYDLINAAIGNPVSNLWLSITSRILFILQFIIWLLYHRKILQQDNKETQVSLNDRHAAFSTLILEPEHELPLVDQLVGQLQRKLPDVPIQRYKLGGILSADSLKNTASIVLPMQLAISLSAELQQQLQTYTGKIILLPHSSDQYTTINATNLNQNEVIKSSINTIRQMAEGQNIKHATVHNGWVIAGYIFGAFLAFYFLMILFGLFIGY